MKQVLAWSLGAAVVFAASLVATDTAANAATPEADLSITLTHTADPSVPSKHVTYTLHVANAGSAATSIKVVNAPASRRDLLQRGRHRLGLR